VTAANGDRAPDRMLVAVRASAPVAAMPPKNGATMFPIPSATSSELGSCLVSVTPSATTADSSDSIAPSMAIANAAGSSSRIRPYPSGVVPHGSAGVGNMDGMPATSTPPTMVWNRVPIVATSRAGNSRAIRATPAVTPAIAISGAGTLRVTRGNTTSSPNVTAAIASSLMCAVPRACQNAASLAKKCSGSGPVARPNASLICSAAITVAMPVVKPVVTG